jgi:hypothetical protein
VFGHELCFSEADTNVCTDVNAFRQQTNNHRLPLEFAGLKPSAPERFIAFRRFQNISEAVERQCDDGRQFGYCRTST